MEAIIKAFGVGSLGGGNLPFLFGTIMEVSGDTTDIPGSKVGEFNGAREL